MTASFRGIGIYCSAFQRTADATSTSVNIGNLIVRVYTCDSSRAMTTSFPEIFASLCSFLKDCAKGVISLSDLSLSGVAPEYPTIPDALNLKLPLSFANSTILMDFEPTSTPMLMVLINLLDQKLQTQTQTE